MTLTCLVISSEASWLTERLHDVLLERQPAGLSVLDGVQDSGAPLPGLLVADDPRHPEVCRVLRRRGRPAILSAVVDQRPVASTRRTRLTLGTNPASKVRKSSPFPPASAGICRERPV